MNSVTMPTPPSQVRDVYNRYPDDVRQFLMTIRQFIFEEAAKHPKVGMITETLKWGEPSYLTEHPKTGTTIRLSWREKSPNQFTLAVHCQTSLVASYRDIYGSVFTFEGSRAIIFERGKTYPDDAIRHCIALAQTYHLKT